MQGQLLHLRRGRSRASWSTVPIALILHTVSRRTQDEGGARARARTRGTQGRDRRAAPAQTPWCSRCPADSMRSCVCRTRPSLFSARAGERCAKAGKAVRDPLQANVQPQDAGHCVAAVRADVVAAQAADAGETRERRCRDAKGYKSSTKKPPSSPPPPTTLPTPCSAPPSHALVRTPIPRPVPHPRPTPCSAPPIPRPVPHPHPTPWSASPSHALFRIPIPIPRPCSARVSPVLEHGQVAVGHAVAELAHADVAQVVVRQAAPIRQNGRNSQPRFMPRYA